MESYVNIYTAYSNRTELNLESMEAVYRDKDRLKHLISSVMSDRLTKDKIAGKKILLKPNWVLHDKTESDRICLRTHDAFLLVALELLLEMQPERIVLGDAPVQGCNWERMLSTDFIESVHQLSGQYKVPVSIKDFRRVSYNPETNQLEQNRNAIEEFIIFDVGKRSYLEEVSDDERSPFRVTNYDPGRLAESHRKGVHKYCITKELFDADLVITVPKIKTHQKAGLTNALKILVGVNGDKDYLPHHRKGALGDGGDCYPGKNPLRKMSEDILDYANTKIGKPSYKPLLHLTAALWRVSKPDNEQNLAAGWYGNDTTWRMVLDINQVVLFGKLDGTLSDTVQRELYSLCDGIVAGQGDGPLKPDPLALGVVAFSNDAAFMDIVAGNIMRMEVDKITLLHNAKDWLKNKDCLLTINQKQADIKNLKNYSVKAIMPPGWVNYDKKL